MFSLYNVCLQFKLFPVLVLRAEIRVLIVSVPGHCLLVAFINCFVKCSICVSSLQCYSVLSDIWVKTELCIPLESESSVLSTCNAFVCLSPPSKHKFDVLFCFICKGLISFCAILF